MTINKSVIINTQNEQNNIQECLDSIKSWADEIIIVDMESSDDTLKIVKQNKVKIFHHPNVGYVEPARNYAISKTSGNWILIIDADERANPVLLSKLDQIIKEDAGEYVWVPRSNIIFGRWIQHARWWPDYNIRFFKKKSVKWQSQIHSVPTAQGREIYLEQNLDLSLKHLNYQTISQFILRMDRYTDQQVKTLILQNYKFKWPDLFQKPGAEFVSRFFAGEGYKDGVHGLAVCLLQATSELVLYLKLWQDSKFNAEDISPSSISDTVRILIKDYYYWLSKIQTNKLLKFAHKLKRKFS